MVYVVPPAEILELKVSIVRSGVWQSSALMYIPSPQLDASASVFLLLCGPHTWAGILLLVALKRCDL